MDLSKHETGGGAIQDALTHQINLGEWLVGPVTRLVCDAEHLALPGVQVEDTAHVLARQRLRWMPAPQADWQERSFGPRERDDPFKDQAAMFLDAIEGRSEVACTLEEGWQTLRVNLAALASVRDGAWQALPAGPGSHAVSGAPR
jgi:predicted dehydrogenase